MRAAFPEEPAVRTAMNSLRLALAALGSWAALAAAAAAPAQESAPTPAKAQGEPKLGPRSFFPADYDSEAFVDFRRLQETELWDQLERSPLVKLALKKFEQEFGFDLGDVDELRAAFAWREVEIAPEISVRAPDPVMVFQCRKDVRLPPLAVDGEGRGVARRAVTIGGVDTVQEGDDTGEGKPGRYASYQASSMPPLLYVVPQPRCFVQGAQWLIEPVLRGERQGGVPRPELLAATASGPPPLGHMAMALRWDEKLLNQVLPFPIEWYTEKDPPSFVVLRLDAVEGGAKGETSSEAKGVAQGEAKTEAKDEAAERGGALRASMRLRFTDGSEGPAKLEAGLREALAGFTHGEELKDMPLLRDKLAKLAGKIEFARDGADLTMSLDLGTGGRLIAELMNALPAALLGGSTGAAPFIYTTF